MACGVWLLANDFDNAPLAHLVQSCIGAEAGEDANSASSLSLHTSGDRISQACYLYAGWLEGGSVHAARWILPLTHAMVRTLVLPHGNMSRGGRVVDMRTRQPAQRHLVVECLRGAFKDHQVGTPIDLWRD